MIVDFRQGVWWDVLDERLQLWDQCYRAFQTHASPPAASASSTYRLQARKSLMSCIFDIWEKGTVLKTSESAFG